ncbi:LuxR C-terminal-related transcriptional regulator [Massilia antarctica]|uniref:LuxR C-terminal-related transcriptional regulator n=1 Tax=Massilia antarctica TaxID=2765360 RepID=UPI0006BB6B07|nr:LuxR C-terminal-related transcriptional regulator [Massilia sp. H27-R4]MCY0914277.1 LuxR C-terminal-related transcriptional regulator [Massilia sp. H27-R4]CUI08690.1 Transcriptional activator of maltose regulon, MalT [Janthinobacterium sp. CG23_2]CUU32476.1 Transcriptional activator of maltose regulon, MalT [Janthinobacterium sp. CG23_2]
MTTEAKFHPPALPARFFPVPRLHQRIAAVAGARIVCLVAPAGFGKSTTMAHQMAALAARAVGSCWVNLDAADNDLERFLLHVTTALAAAHPFGAGATAHASGRAQLLAMCNRLTHQSCDVALFFDDYHVIDNPAVHELMDWLLAVSPVQLTLYIGSRSRIPLKLSRLRLCGGVADLGAADLSLTREETCAFMDVVSAGALDGAHCGVLYERTEGWAAGLQLAAIALQNAADRERFIHDFSGSAHDIASYLMEAVLARLPPQVDQFMSRTALFDRFSGRLCQDALALRDAPELIDWIAAHNLFLIPLDRRGESFRYHHLLGEYLRTRYLNADGAAARADYRAASHWCERAGENDEAIRYALAGDDSARAVDLIAGCVDELIRARAGFDTLLRWMSAVPYRLLAQRVQLRLTFIRSSIWNNRFEQAESALAELEYDLGTGAPVAGVGAILCTMEMLWCLLYAFQDKTALAASRSRAWLARWGGSAQPSDIARAHIAIGYSAYVAHDYAVAEQSCQSAETFYAAADFYSGVVWTERFISIIRLEQGQAREAERVLAALYIANRDRLGADSMVASHTGVHLAQAAYELDKIDAAAAALDSALTIPTDAVAPAPGEGGPIPHGFGLLEDYMAAYLTRARLLCVQGQGGAADSVLANGVASALQCKQVRLARILMAERIRLALRQDEVALAASHERALDAIDATAGPAARGRAEAEEVAVGIARIRLRLAQGGAEAGAIGARLQELIARARLQTRLRMLVKLLCLQARYHGVRAEHEEAGAALHEALLIGEEGGLCRSIADEGPQVRALVASHGAWQAHSRRRDARLVTPDYLAHLLAACGAPAHPVADDAAAGAAALPESHALSPREVQVLKLAERGLANRELAALLFVSEGTVKWHLHNIFAKLAVRNRSGAVARARSLNLL